MSSFEITLRDALPHGVIVGVRLPETVEPVPEKIWAQLHPAEREQGQTLSPRRQAEFAAGRIAAQSAIQSLGKHAGPILRDNWGAPVPPPGVTISLTHKTRSAGHHSEEQPPSLAIALAARDRFGSIGVDLEELTPARPGVERKVLTQKELEEVAALPLDRQWTETVGRFAIKEAIYKALAPRLHRYIGFQEAEVQTAPDGQARVRLLLEGTLTPAFIEGRTTWLNGCVLATVRARWS